MRTKLVIAAVVTAAAVSAVGASAYTESITGGTATKVVGYATTAITGAAMDTRPCCTTAPASTRSTRSTSS